MLPNVKFKLIHYQQIRYVIRNESVTIWEHFYQSLKKELITENPINNEYSILDAQHNLVVNTNESLATTLKNCYDEWISSESDSWASAISYGKCNVLTMQHVISVQSSEEDKKNGVDRFKLIKDEMMKVIKHSSRPLIVLISDIKSDDTRDRILDVKAMIEATYSVKVVRQLHLTGVTHIGYTLPEYQTNFGLYANYNHYQTIWKIEDLKP